MKGKMHAKCAIGVLGFSLALAMSPPLRSADKPQPLKLGETAHVTLAADGSRDYSVALGKGSYRLIWDAKRVDGQKSNIIGKIRLLKPNGVVIDNYLLTFNETEAAYRVGTILKVPKPFVARFRLQNNYAIENWFTIVPVANVKRVPFGWGSGVTPARIASENGVGGTIKPTQSLYHSITLPKGKWSVSLGFERADGQKSNVIGSVDLLDTLGLALKQNLVSLNEIETQARSEGVVTVVKPTSYLLRVTNDSSNADYKYDVTIEPAN